MISLHDQLPRYLLGKYQLTWTVTFTALFSLIAIIVCVPFYDSVWFHVGDAHAFGLTVSFVLLSMAIVIASRRGMYSCRSLADFTVLRYVVWNIAEILIVALLYSFITVQGGRMGIIDDCGRDFGDIFGGAAIFTAVCLGVPYVISTLYLALDDKNNTIRMMNYSNVVSDVPAKPYEDRRITLFDNNGIMKFCISLENLYFIESDDNYIKVWYEETGGEVKQYMLRCRLKTVEDSFMGSDLVRCHRKYIVNITKVRILKAGRDGYSVTLDLEGFEPIPISKTYEESVLARFNSK